MIMTIKVGHISNPANQVRINDPSVSRMHLEVSKIDNDTLRIVDLGSTNGTRIDGVEIMESTLKKHQSIRIGHQNFTGEEFFRKVNRHFLDRRVLWHKEFAQLETQFKKYEKEKAKLSQSLQLKMNIVRAILIATFSLFFHFYGEKIGIPADFKLFIGLVGGIVAAIIIPYLVSKENTTDKMYELKRAYASTLACPRCQRDLTNASFNFWKGEKRCSSCDAVWLE